ncbi:hypothetical protein N7541_000465 [Penicillium brevicompactum]|uniref:Uncharacterized protein n=1 Tax=Penicillium brevicompactum TaxID=5074 RepID=A0A9W9RWC0_PENBR|nr:hypothetical protein N7541_000465 [Penicillium brevicompactum]
MAATLSSGATGAAAAGRLCGQWGSRAFAMPRRFEAREPVAAPGRVPVPAAVSRTMIAMMMIQMATMTLARR